MEIAAVGSIVYVTWWERNATSNEPVLRVSNDNGKTFGEKIMLSEAKYSYSQTRTIAFFYLLKAFKMKFHKKRVICHSIGRSLRFILSVCILHGGIMDNLYLI